MLRIGSTVQVVSKFTIYYMGLLLCLKPGNVVSLNLCEDTSLDKVSKT